MRSRAADLLGEEKVERLVREGKEMDLDPHWNKAAS